MPDPIVILEALGAAAVAAAALVVLGAWLGRTSHPAWASAGGVLGVGLGFLAGCWVLGVRPHWPPQEDQDRLLLILWPAILGVELAAAILGTYQRLFWLPRLAVAGAAAWVLLYQSSYLTDLAGPGTREWTPAQSGSILGALAVSLAGVWAALALLARRMPVQLGKRQAVSVPLTTALACAGAAVTVMLSGYATGGQLGLPLAAALVGAVLSLLLLAQSRDIQGVLSLGIVGLFALLVIGRFFGNLTLGNAALLFFAPLLGWLPELPYIRRIRPLFRGTARVVLTAVPVVVALMLAQQQFRVDSERNSSGAPEPSIQDYLDYGK